MDRDKHIRNDFSDVDSLPSSDAGLHEIIAFLDSQNPAAKFQKLWGQDYSKNVEILWQRCTQAFREGDPITMGPDELLLCLKYDSAIAPYISRPESQSLLFYHHLLEEIRNILLVG